MIIFNGKAFSGSLQVRILRSAFVDLDSLLLLFPTFVKNFNLPPAMLFEKSFEAVVCVCTRVCVCVWKQFGE